MPGCAACGQSTTVGCGTAAKILLTSPSAYLAANGWTNVRKGQVSRADFGRYSLQTEGTTSPHTQAKCWYWHTNKVALPQDTTCQAKEH